MLNYTVAAFNREDTFPLVKISLMYEILDPYSNISITTDKIVITASSIFITLMMWMPAVYNLAKVAKDKLVNVGGRV